MLQGAFNPTVSTEITKLFAYFLVTDLRDYGSTTCCIGVSKLSWSVETITSFLYFCKLPNSMQGRICLLHDDIT